MDPFIPNFHGKAQLTKGDDVGTALIKYGSKNEKRFWNKRSKDFEDIGV